MARPPARNRLSAEALGGEQVEGRRAVLELLRAGRRPVRSVSVSSSVRDDPVIDEIRTRAGGSLQIVSAERIDGLALEQYVNSHQVGPFVAPVLVIERCVPPGPRFQLVEEVEDDLGQR